MRFLGNIEAKADAKGRAFLPAMFRKVLQTLGDEQLVMRKDVFQDCLVLYPRAVWDAQMEVMEQRLDPWNPLHRQLLRQFVSDAERVELDGNGRFLIPKRYLKMAFIEQNIRFIGMGDTIEIWSAAKLEKPFVEAEDFGKALQQILSTPGSTPPPHSPQQP